MGLKAQMAQILPADVLPYVSDHFEVIGDIAVLALPAELEPYKRILAEAIVSCRKNICTVLNKTGKITGAARTAHYETLLGETTVTLHHEFGFSYRFDVRKSFFSTRMADERKRVTDQVEAGERVYVPFAGVGPFAIPAAARRGEVYAVEKNPDAFRWLQENVGLNRVSKNCHILQGDAFDTARLPHQRFDRLIIPAPYGMDYALDALIPLLSGGGIVHFYTFRAKEQVPGLIAAYEEKGFTVTYFAACGTIAPGISRRVFDMEFRLQQERRVKTASRLPAREMHRFL
jgi:tRNA (guanine37-N1)-methyltransferase